VKALERAAGATVSRSVAGVNTILFTGMEGEIAANRSQALIFQVPANLLGAELLASASFEMPKQFRRFTRLPRTPIL